MANVAYSELHCRSNFSFLQGASHPEQLVEQAVALELQSLALTDRNGLYGIVRFAQTARALGLPTVFGAELQCSVGEAVGDIVVIARNTRGYAHLSSAISAGQLAGSK
jgi:error-prone DNA polymerase